MKIAILSDIHDNVSGLKLAITQIQKMKAETLLFCGDFCAPFVIAPLAEFKEDIHVVFGNNDGDRFHMATIVQQNFPHVKLHGEHAALEIDNKRIGMTHYPFYAQAMAKSGDFDLVTFGHDHNPRVLEFGSALAINPGSIYGNKAPPSFALYDTIAHAATLYALDGSFLTI